MLFERKLNSQSKEIENEQINGSGTFSLFTKDNKEYYEESPYRFYLVLAFFHTFYLSIHLFQQMSTEEDLLNDFFAEINSLPTPSLSTEPEKKKVLI